MNRQIISNNERANILIHALPYIQEFQGKTIVVKYGGSAMQSNELKTAVIEDIILMACVGIRTILVHGGGPEIEAMLKKTGKESRFIDGLRYTDEETMDVVQMVLCGRINKEIVALIEKNGGKAIGLCGIDFGLLKARRIKTDNDLGLVGEIEKVDTSFLNSILESSFTGTSSFTGVNLFTSANLFSKTNSFNRVNGVIPVISSVAYGTGDDEGKALNINADIAAAKIAGAIGAEKLVLMTDVKGILQDVNNDESLVKSATLSQLEQLKKEGILSKGMIPKADCCEMALKEGVKKAHIIDGRLLHAILIELFTDEGIGTQIIKE